MGQQEIYDFLKKHPTKWFTSREISEQIGISLGSVTMSLKKLRKSKLIKFRISGKRNQFEYSFKK
ncbi:winged helix-turn-helix transcriptional regulator [Candidatus Woesearchaeota archaeon]|nr:winged helix-turn-helix transcriptional regulator [Candidatus Woesearchaeota archaeon]